jgi:peroxin-19
MNLESILDEALSEFEKDGSKISNSRSKVMKEAINAVSCLPDEKVHKENIAKHVAQGLNDEEFGETLQSTLKALSQSSEGSQTVQDLFKNLNSQFKSKSLVELKSSTSLANTISEKSKISSQNPAVFETFAKVKEAQEGQDDCDPKLVEATGEAMMEEMIQKFEELGEKEDYNQAIDGVMKQLLSKEMMYEPARLLCEKYPEWLVLNKSHLTEEQYMNYGRQYQTFQKIVAVYDNEPDNFPRFVNSIVSLECLE